MDMYRHDRVWRKFKLADHANTPQRDITRKALVGLGLMSPEDYLDWAGKRFSINRSPLAHIVGLTLSHQFLNRFESHFVTITPRHGHADSLQLAYIANTLDFLILSDNFG